MKKKVQIFGIEIDCCTAKDAMKRVVQFMKTEPVNVIEMVTMRALGRIQESEDVKKQFGVYDIILASDKAILEAAGVSDERKLKEVEESLFLNLFMHYLYKNHSSVFLLARDDSDLQAVSDVLQENYDRIRVADQATLEEADGSNDWLINRINGAEADCVISTLPTPLEEQVVFQNKSLVNARIWIGAGPLLVTKEQEKKGFQKVRQLLMRHVLRREVERERKEKDIVKIDNGQN